MTQPSSQLVGLERIPDDQWAFYQEVIRTVRALGQPAVLGGGFALATYTGQYRNTKDLDLFIQPHARDELVAALARLDVRDLYEEQPYDRGWIYRGTRDGFIIDLIWSMANYRAEVDDSWLRNAPTITIRGEQVQVLPAEEMIWNKLYIMHSDRCDWPDVFNLLHAVGPELDWDRLVAHLGDDLPVLAGALSVFSWLSPGRAAALPSWLWERMSLRAPQPSGPQVDRGRVDYFDSRPWFIPALEPGEQPFSIEG